MTMRPFILGLGLVHGLTAASMAVAGTHEEDVEKILQKVPLVDGHNDVPWAVRKRADGDLSAIPLGEGTANLDPPMHTDIPRLREGMAGAEFWSVYVPASMDGPEAVQTTLEQIDLVHQMVAMYPDDFALALTADDVRRIHKQGKIASMIGMEGGHSIGSSLPVLRQMYAVGARYMTLTHWKTHDWADAATDAPQHDGLSDFGFEVVAEMNRLGMLVDLSHVSAATMHDALDHSRAPVIFSHSGAQAINSHPRNVPDDVLVRLKDNGGVVMVDFLPAYVSEEVWEHGNTRKAEMARLEGQYLGDPAGLEAAQAAWNEANPGPMSTLAQVVDHIDHIRDVAGIDHIGVGTDFDGMWSAPVGLEDVSKVPALFVALLEQGYTKQEVAKIAGLNILRVMEQAETVAE